MTRAAWRNTIYSDHSPSSVETSERRSKPSGRRTLSSPLQELSSAEKGDLAAVGQPDKPIRIYHANTGRELRELTFKALPEAEHSSIAFDSDARLVAYAKTNGLVSVEEAGTGRELYNLNTGVSQSPQRIAFSNNLLLTVTDPGGTGEPPTMKLWDTTTGQFVRTLSTNEQNDSRVFGLAAMVV